jgi:hypothetical protein
VYGGGPEAGGEEVSEPFPAAMKVRIMPSEKWAEVTRAMATLSEAMRDLPPEILGKPGFESVINALARTAAALTDLHVSALLLEDGLKRNSLASLRPENVN